MHFTIFETIKQYLKMKTGCWRCQTHDAHCNLASRRAILAFLCLFYQFESIPLRQFYMDFRVINSCIPCLIQRKNSLIVCKCGLSCITYISINHDIWPKEPNQISYGFTLSSIFTCKLLFSGTLQYLLTSRPSANFEKMFRSLL